MRAIGSLPSALLARLLASILAFHHGLRDGSTLSIPGASMYRHPPPGFMDCHTKISRPPRRL